MTSRHPIRTAILGSVSALTLLASAAAAQEAATDAAATAAADQPAEAAGGTVVLETITLTATSDASVQAQGYVGSYTQAATKSDTPTAEQQQSVSVVTTAQIADRGAQNLGQALNYSAGVIGQPFGGDPRFDGPVIRGFAGDQAQYLNGLRSLRSFSAPAYDTYGLQQVEVLKGPSSSLYGSGTPGGMINQVQKRAQATDFAEAGVGFDSNAGRNVFFDVNRAASDSLAYRLTGIARHTEQQIEELDNDRGYLAGALRYTPTDDTTVDVILSYAKDKPASPARVPFALTEIADQDDLRDFYAGEEDLDDSDRKIGTISVELSHAFASGWTLQQGFRYETFDWDYTSVYSNGLSADGRAITRGYIAQAEDSSNLNLDTRLAGEVMTGAATHKLLFGLDMRQFDLEDATDFGNVPDLDWRDPVYGAAVRPTAFWYQAENDLKLRQIGIYAQDEIEAGNWRGTLALRQDWTKQSGTTFNNFAGRAEVDQSDHALTGRAGVGYQLASGVMPYLSYSTSFDPEIGADIEGDALEPTRGKQWEVGVKYQPTAFDGLISAALYDLRQENVSRTVQEGGISGTRQIGEVRSRGFEVEGTAAIGTNWDVRGGYAYNDTEQQGGPNDGESLPNAPRHTLGLFVARGFDNGVRVSGGLRHLSERNDGTGDALEVDAVTLLDLGASYTRGNVEGQVNVLNATDKVYLANCNGFGCNYGEGRTVQARIAYKW